MSASEQDGTGALRIGGSVAIDAVAHGFEAERFCRPGWGIDDVAREVGGSGDSKAKSAGRPGDARRASPTLEAGIDPTGGKMYLRAEIPFRLCRDRNPLRWQMGFIFKPDVSRRRA